MTTLRINAREFFKWQLEDMELSFQDKFNIIINGKAPLINMDKKTTSEEFFGFCGYLQLRFIDNLHEVKHLFTKEELEEEELQGETKFNIEWFSICNVKVKAEFEYDSVEFTLIGLVDKQNYEEQKGFGLGYVGGGDMMTDAEGFDMHTVLEGKEFYEAYCLVTDGSVGRVNVKIIED